ncbi:hypothetical protein [Actinoplanes sp. ATCC 53533]|uniref:hypothetical protein n=1 Tax=Actinoplanes sp. ATCC 53533 TaxID=1288362 RepID=UPI0013157D3D|nr:hypothetical protein [Actinoplanes sp. ATCC 53533]
MPLVAGEVGPGGPGHPRLARRPRGVVDGVELGTPWGDCWSLVKDRGGEPTSV